MTSITIESGPWQYPFTHLRKYYDTILFGVNSARERLPSGHGQDMKINLDLFKSSKVRRKKDAELNENEADPINLTLYTIIYQWAISIADIFLWTFSILLWN